ncbi:hypothetical protein [Actinokineospora pegani]|uniref:hypothetical protein n=1 Tax=Actinokineospora pegani TaxID=2654637 RepID=UPI0012EA86F6|nr:hypothetical protein [Actinokineospora pegani]
MNAQLRDPMYTFKPEGPTEMLLHENLARSRMREADQVARARHLVRRLSAARRWQRVSKWAAKRAAHLTAIL